MIDVNTRCGFTPGFLDSLKTATREQLESAGLRLWSSRSEKALWLFPKDFYNEIPTGYRVTDIHFREAPFSRQTHDDDARYGMLAFGIVHAYGCGLAERPVCRCFDDVSRDCGRHGVVAAETGLYRKEHFDAWHRGKRVRPRPGSLWSQRFW